MDSSRKDHLSWDEYFMAIAKLSAMRSKDPNTQVGACIASKDHKILSVGYNGTPNGWDDADFPWERDGGHLDTKYYFVLHAERNAILNYRGSRRDMEDATLYVSLFPCNECAKELVQSGIKEVVFLTNKYDGSDEVEASKMILEHAGISYRQLVPSDNFKQISLEL